MQSVLLIDDVEYAKSKSTAWIWIGHFHEDDINLDTWKHNLVAITTKNYSVQAKFNKHRWNGQPPLPTASKEDVLKSKYYNKLRGGDTLSASRSSSSRKRKAEILLSPLNSNNLSMLTNSQDESPLTAINHSTPCGSYSNNDDIVGVVNDIIDVIGNKAEIVEVVVEEDDENSFDENSQSSRPQEEEKEEILFSKYKTMTTQTDVNDKSLYPNYNKTLKKENVCTPYIGSQLKLYDLLIVIHDHGRRCGGNINYLSRSWTQRGLAYL